MVVFGFRYTAREFDPETNLSYYRARYYDPAAGRFLSEDPARFWAGINFYAYVDNNPPNEFDPFGLDPPNKVDLIRRIICNKDCADYLGGLPNVLRAIMATRYIDLSDPAATAPPDITKRFSDNPLLAAFTVGRTTYYRSPPDGFVIDSIIFLHELRHVQGHREEIDTDYNKEYETIEKLCPQSEVPTTTSQVPGGIE